MSDFTARITEILGAHRLEQGMRIGHGARVEWWECLECDWQSGRFEIGHPDIEGVKRGHHADIIAAAAEDHYRPRIETVDELMSDPAVEAAQRAWGFDSNWEFHDRTTGGMSVAAAREALKPIQELHKKTGSLEYPGHDVCPECDNWWPCGTAKLVYTTEELER